jgi:hypothetical protein
VKTFVSAVRGTIADEDACFGTKIKFVFVIRSEMGPTGTTKDSHEAIIWLGLEEFSER